MRGDPRVRIGTIKDLDDLVNLEIKGFQSDRFTRAQYQHLLTRANATVLVLAYSKKMVGAAIMLWRYNATVGRLYNIVIDPDMQGKSLGTILLRSCEREAHKRNCREISLEVRADNSSAIHFYEKHNYRTTETLPGYYEDGTDGYRMIKTLGHDRSERFQLKIPYYGQTLEFTCGAACLMMAFKFFVPEMELTRLLEVSLWRDATLVFMTSGMGGCGPFGLALAAKKRGFPVRVVLSREQTPFFSSVRNKDKRKVIRLVHDDLRTKALDAGVDVDYYDFTFEEIASEMRAGKVPVVLVSTYRLHGDRAPHYVVLTAFDKKYVYFHDSYEGFYEHDRRLAQNVRIPIAEFRKMRRYGKNLYKCVLFISPPTDKSPVPPPGPTKS